MNAQNRIREISILGLLAMVVALSAILVSSATAGLTVVDSNSAFHDGAGTMTISNIVVSGDINMLLVGVAGKGGGTVSGAWGATSLGTPIVSESYAGTWAKIFACSNLTASTENLEVTVSDATGGESFGVGVLSLSTPGTVGLAVEAQGTNGPGGPLSVAFGTATKSSDLVFGVAGANGAGSSPASSNLTANLLSTNDGGYPSFAITADYDTSPIGQHFTWTASTDRFAVGAVLIRAVPPAGTIVIIK